MDRRPPIQQRTHTLCPYPTRFRSIDLAGVVAADRLADHVAEPAEQHGNHAGDADEERRLAPAALVEPAAETDHGHEQRDRAEERPAAAVWHEVDIDRKSTRLNSSH